MSDRITMQDKPKFIKDQTRGARMSTERAEQVWADFILHRHGLVERDGRLVSATASKPVEKAAAQPWYASDPDELPAEVEMKRAPDARDRAASGYVLSGTRRMGCDW